MRSRTSLVQTIGRAARRVSSQVIMYADSITGSMQAAIAETDRRREIQTEFNRRHHITPSSIEKNIHDISERLAEIQPAATTAQEIDFSKIKPGDIQRLTRDLEREMKLAAENLDFERAALIRDQIIELKKANLEVPKTITPGQVK